MLADAASQTRYAYAVGLASDKSLGMRHAILAVFTLCASMGAVGFMKRCWIRMGSRLSLLRSGYRLLLSIIIFEMGWEVTLAVFHKEAFCWAFSVCPVALPVSLSLFVNGSKGSASCLSVMGIIAISATVN